MLPRILLEQARARRRARWTRDRIQVHQDAALARLRTHAYQSSRFYRDRHRGLTDRPLSELPVVTKAELMEHFDELVVDPRVRLPDLLAHLEHLQGDELFADRYRVCATAGTTGMRGLFLFDRAEWAAAIASYERAMHWAGVASGLVHRPRIAIVSSRVPSHGSARVGATLGSGLVPVLRLDAVDPLEDIVTRLNDFAPRVLVAYASMLRVLAEAKLEGRLRVAPDAVISASEVLTPEMRRLADRAFGVPVFNVYAATETATIAAECAAHGAMHIFEDFLIAEVVDDDNQPVPAETFGSKLLVTVLFNRSQPLIRYEISDRVSLASAQCPCGSAFRSIDAVEGRKEDVLILANASGAHVPVQPNVFHAALERLAPHGWQVTKEADRLRVLVVDGREPVDATRIASTLQLALSRLDVRNLTIVVEHVSRIPRTALGKAPLVRCQAP